MKVKLTVELTPTLIETLSPDQLKDVIYQFLAIEAESKVKSEVILSANAEGALNAIESAKSVINENITNFNDITEKNNKIIENWNKNNRPEFHVQPLEIVKLKIPEYIKENIESDLNNLVKPEVETLTAYTEKEGIEKANRTGKPVIIVDTPTKKPIKPEVETLTAYTEKEGIEKANRTGKPVIIVDTPTKKPRKAQKPSEFIKTKTSEDIPMSKVIDLYKNGISLAKICRKYDIKSTTLFSRLKRLGLTVVKKKS